MKFFKRSDGFTLIEIQIAILILLLIVAVLMGGLQLSSKTTKSAEKLSEHSNELRIINRIFKQQLNELTPLSTLNNGQNKLIFKGERHSVYYMSYLSEHVVKGGPWLMHLYVKNKQLLLGYRVFDNTQSVQQNFAENFQKIILLNNIDDVTIFYRGQQDGSWQTHWNNKNKMPILLKIQIKQDQFEWPGIVAKIYSSQAINTPFHVININEK